MLYKVTNKANQPLVCSLADNSTLRLSINQSAKITSSQVTNHLKTLSSKRYILLEEVVETKKSNKNDTKKSVVENKEVNKNGNL